MNDATLLANLIFELDGSLPAAQLEGLPAEIRERVTSPDFVAQAREAIRRQRLDAGEIVKTGRRESRLEPIQVFRFSKVSGLNRKARRRMAAALRG